MLCDRDPGVMGATLNVIESLARVNVQPFKDLVPSLISILKQICERRLPSEYDYHRIPAPWMQMKIVRILSVIGKNDIQASEGMYEIVGDCLRYYIALCSLIAASDIITSLSFLSLPSLKTTRKAEEAGINASNAIVYECIRCITVIYPNSVLLDAAGSSISRFLSSRSQNLRYLGVTGLASIVERHPKYAADHQLAVIECLEDKDDTLLRKTLDLLYRMTNPVNVEFITDRLLHFLRGSTDPYLKKDLTGKICTIAERYAPNNGWYVRTVTELFKIAGDLVDPAVAQNLMSLVAEGTGNEDGDEEADMVLRKQAVELYVSLLASAPNRMNRVLVETLAWVLGEYGYLSSIMSLDAIIDGMCNLLNSGNTAKLGGGAPSTRRIILSAIMKMVSQYGSCPALAAKVVDAYTKSSDPDTQKRCLEFQTMLTTAPHMLGEVFPVDASLEDVDVDENLSFLDGLVAEAVSNGARTYQKPEDDDDDDMYGGSLSSETANAFKMTPYEKPTQTYGQGRMSGMGSTNMGPGGSANVTLPPGGAASPTHQAVVAPVQPINPAQPQLQLRNVANVWGKQVPPPAPVIASTPTAPAPTSYGGVGGGFASPAPAIYGGYGGGFGASAAPAPAAPIKTAEQIEKERLAAALFGGISATSQPPIAPPAPPAPVATPQMTPVISSPAPISVAAASISSPVPAVAAPAPEVDLLDMGAWGADTTGAMAVATPSTFDMLSPSPLVESTEPVPPPAAPAPEPAPPLAANIDPFADAGLLDGLTESAQLSSFGSSDMSSARFEYAGVAVAPLSITTPQFGERWGQCPSTHPVNVPSSTSASTLSKFMELCEKAGMYKVEEIAATNEGIAACMAGGGSAVALVHGKISPLPGGQQSRVDVTVKSTDAQLGGTLAMYLQNMIR
jgi:AP-4 complex subunit epsilon-1